MLLIIKLFHFTSPIRRYPDLLVHRAIKSLIKSNHGNIKIENPVKTKPIYSHDQLIESSKSCSTKERIAESRKRSPKPPEVRFASENIEILLMVR